MLFNLENKNAHYFMFYQILLLLGIFQIKISNNFFIGYSNVVEALLNPAIPAVVEVLVKVVHPVPHHSLPGELSLEILALIQGGNLPVVTEGRKGAFNKSGLCPRWVFKRFSGPF